MIDFTNKVLVISGGGAGIGRAVVEGFIKMGGRVAVIEKCPKLTDSLIGDLGSEPLIVTGDVTNQSTVNDFAKSVKAHYGGVDVLVNNVGDYLGLAKPFARYSDDDIDRLYQVNLKQVFDMTRAFLPLLKTRSPGSSVISISSIEGFRGIPMGAVYAAFKAGLDGFTKSLALELGPSGIRVNAVAPETTRTPQVPIDDIVADEHKDFEPHWIPLGRFGKAEDIAGAILYLASDLAGWVTGTTLHVDGGALAAGGWYRDANGVWTNMPIIPTNGPGLVPTKKA